MVSINTKHLVHAELIIRLFLILIFFLGGLGKLFDINGFVTSLSEPFKASPLPIPFVKGFLYSVPFLEGLAGLLLIVNYQRRWALIFLAGLLITFAFGHMMIQEFESVNRVLIDLFAVVLVYILPSKKEFNNALQNNKVG